MRMDGGQSHILVYVVVLIIPTRKALYGAKSGTQVYLSAADS